jgi:drug/metabolite transporter (DMT)-like permease
MTSFKISRRGSASAWVHLAATLTIIFWGMSFAGSKVLLDNGFSPVQVYVGRCLIAYVLLLLMSRGSLRAHSLQHELLFLLSGVCGGSVYFITENASLLYTSSTNVSLITCTTPLITALLVGVLYRSERPNAGVIIGSIVAFAGVSLIVIGGAEHSAADANSSAGLHLLGDFLALMSAICWSLYSLLLRKLNPIYSAIAITRKTFFYGLVTSIPFLAFDHTPFHAERLLQPVVMGNFLFLGVLASTVCFALWAWVVGKMGAIKSGTYLYFQPIVTMIGGALILHEAITPMGLTGSIITIGGVALGNQLSRRIARRGRLF